MDNQTGFVFVLVTVLAFLIVAKHSHGPYITEPQQSTWFKIRNRNYSQMEGREKLFERERHKEPAPGWHGCDLACAEMEQEYAG
jgi:hypothetical protein